MGRKSHPIIMRLGITQDWLSRWFNKNNYAGLLREDTLIREVIEKKLKNAGLERISIERNPNLVVINIRTSRPGLVIGRSGSGIEDLKKGILKFSKTPMKIEIQEIRDPDAYAILVAKSIAEQLEKRMPFRRVLKQTLERVAQNKGISGVKLQVAGRLGGAEMSRREWLSRGKLPLQTLQADIDFARVTAATTHGAVGVKVWLNKGKKNETRTSKS